MDSAAKDNGKPASAGRSVGDAFFLHVSPHREAAARRFGHLNANGIPTEHPVQMPVKSSSNACFSRLDGSSIYIDPHTHFGFQSAGVKSVDDFATGTKAALAGGTTTIVNCVDSAATAEGLLPLFAKWKEQADSQVYCDYALSVTVPKWSESCKKDMTELVKSHGVNSFKFSTASKGAPMLNDCDLYQAFKHCRQLGALARIHSEHGDLTSLKEEDLLTHEHLSIPEAFLEARPEQLEADCALRACSVSKLAGCPLDLVFVVNKQVARSVGQLRNKGYFVFGETTTASLGADGNGYFHSNWNQAAAHVTLPPLRPDTTIGKALIRRLASGELQMVSSGHCAFKSDQRTKQASGFGNMPHGVTGVEERMMILWQKGVNTGMLDPMRFVAVTSSNAAKLFNLYPSKGRIAVDSDADVVVWDPNEEKVLPGRSQWSSADYSIYEGTKCTGMPVITIAGGKVVFEEGQVKIPAGSGKFVNAAPFSPLAFSRMMMKTADGAKTSMNHLKVSPQKMVQPNSVCQEFHSRPATKAGGRNMLDSSFALSGAQVDDGQGLGHGQKRQTRVTKPPGGDSHRLW